MNITIRPERKEDFETIKILVKESFEKGTEYSDGIIEMMLVDEIRSNKYYIPEYAFVAECDGEIVGYFMLSKFPLSDNENGTDNTDYENGILLLSPVAVRYDCLRKGIGTKMLSQGIEKAKKDGYKAVIVEGNPAFYGTLGCITSSLKNIYPSVNLQLPAPECLMVCELYNDALDGKKKYVDYSMYKLLT